MALHEAQPKRCCTKLLSICEASFNTCILSSLPLTIVDSLKSWSTLLGCCCLLTRMPSLSLTFSHSPEVCHPLLLTQFAEKIRAQKGKIEAQREKLGLGYWCDCWDVSARGGISQHVKCEWFILFGEMRRCFLSTKQQLLSHCLFNLVRLWGLHMKLSSFLRCPKN